MGLNATVYKRIDDVAPEWRHLVGYLNPEMGELYFPEYRNAPDEEVLVEVEEWLTNASGAASMREQLSQMFPAREQPMFDAFLYSGTHCGDYIRVSDLDVVDRDLSRLEAYGELPEELRVFAEQVRRLVDAARRTGNAIVF